MVKFAHIADSHLGSWRQKELEDLNFLSFQRVIDQVLKENVDFVLMAGDLFDSAYPPIEILKETFAEFKKLKDANIPVFLIAGSHDYSASGRTFLDVIEKAGFCKNVEDYTINSDGTFELKPTIFQDIAIYGYPGRKSGMEIEDLHKIRITKRFDKTILMLHTTLTDVIGNIDMNAIDKEKLPFADYYAMGHIHQRVEIDYNRSKFVYPGPTFPNNFQELVDLSHGSFQIVEMNEKITTKNIQIPIKEVVSLEIELENALTATEEIIHKIDRHNLTNKILLLKLKGTLLIGKTGDIRFNQIEEFVQKKGAYSFLRNISKLKTKESEINLNQDKIGNVEEIEKIIQEEFTKENQSEFNNALPILMNFLGMEKEEDEKSSSFETRLLDEFKKALTIEGRL